jgi:hypothetical protein
MKVNELLLSYSRLMNYDAPRTSSEEKNLRSVDAAASMINR